MSKTKDITMAEQLKGRITEYRRTAEQIGRLEKEERDLTEKRIQAATKMRSLKTQIIGLIDKMDAATREEPSGVDTAAKEGKSVGTESDPDYNWSQFHPHDLPAPEPSSPYMPDDAETEKVVKRLQDRLYAKGFGSLESGKILIYERQFAMTGQNPPGLLVRGMTRKIRPGSAAEGKAINLMVSEHKEINLDMVRPWKQFGHRLRIRENGDGSTLIKFEIYTFYYHGKFTHKDDPR